MSSGSAWGWLVGALCTATSASGVDTPPAAKGNRPTDGNFELGLSCGWSLLRLLPAEQRRAVDTSRDVHVVRDVLVQGGRGQALSMTSPTSMT